MMFNNIIYVHKALQINFTTYNNRRAQDTINPCTHSDIMMLSRDDGHPYYYARVLGIYHAMVQLNSSRSRNRELHQIEFLWVCWYNIDKKACGGFAAKRQFQLKFHTGSQAFGFINPADILHTTHLIPNFHKDTMMCLLGRSMACHADKENEDYHSYYVNMWVTWVEPIHLDLGRGTNQHLFYRLADRDMFMRFTGGGISHLSTWELTREFEDEIRAL